MTTEQIQKLSELTQIAVENNDVDSLVKIRKIIEQDEQQAEFKTITGSEWFESLLPSELFPLVFGSN